MTLTKDKIWSAVRKQLAIDLNCSVDDFDREGFVFCEARENPGRRPFPRGERHFEMVTIGAAVIVSATTDILPYLREQLDSKSRDEAFNMPFVHGTAHYFLPDNPQPLPILGGFEINIIEQPGIEKLYQYKGFEYALGYDVNHPRPDVLAAVAIADGKVVGIAGASADCEQLWQTGINILPEYRRFGLAAALTNQLAIAILERGKIPYYGTSSSNVASQRTAHRAGFSPAWVCCYRGRFDCVLTEPTG